jgi:hypothetical protein
VSGEPVTRKNTAVNYLEEDQLVYLSDLGLLNNTVVPALGTLQQAPQPPSQTPFHTIHTPSHPSAPHITHPGFMYVQNALPSGPIAHAFRQVTELPLRWDRPTNIGLRVLG